MLLSVSSCEDNGCISADDFGGTYITVESNPESHYGRYPLQSTEWTETGLRASGGPFRIAISGAWVPWGMAASSQATLTRLQSCFATKNFDDRNPSLGNNFGLCAKRVPINTGATPNSLKVGADRVADLNRQNCICYEGENPVQILNSTRSALSALDSSCNTAISISQFVTDSQSSTGSARNCSCQKVANINGKPPTEDFCTFHFTLADKKEIFEDDATDARFGKPELRSTERQGNICKMEKGMGLYMGLFGRDGNRQPLRAYHLFTQTTECPITRDSAGRCLQESGQNDAAGNPIMVDRTRYIYTTDGMPVYDDKSGNDCTDTNPGDDEYHRMREVIKLKIHDSYFQDNYGSYRVQFLSGVYSDDEALIMEAIVNLIEGILVGEVDPTTGIREGGLLNFLYNSILGNSDFILIVKLCLVFYIVAFGITSLLGLVEVNRKEIFLRIFQIGIVLFFTTENGWLMYDEFVVKFFKNGMDEVVHKFTIYANSFFTEGETTTNPMRAAQLRSANPDSMGSKFAYIDFVIRMLFSEAITKKIWSLFFQSIFGLLYIIAIYYIIFYFLQSMGIIVFVYCITLTKMVMALALGPIFFIFMLFKQTNEYFKKWITFLAARSIEVVILFMLVFVFIALIDRRFNELLYYSACIWELNLWLFKLKFLVARDVFTVDASGNATTNSRDLVDWFLMLSKLLLTIYVSQKVIMQVPQLAGQLVSIGGAGNQTGTGKSYAQDAFSIGANAARDIFGTAGGAGYKAGTKAAGLVYRGGRELLKGTAPMRALGAGLDAVGRERMRNLIIDQSINRAIKEADRKGFTGAERDQYIRNYVANASYKKDKATGSQGGSRDWARQNPNTAGLLNINSDTIAKRLDQKLLHEPMKAAIKAKAKELRKLPANEIPLGKEMKAALEKEALRWAEANTSQTQAGIFEAIDKLKGDHRFAGSKGGWRPRRVNYLDELSKMSYDKAAKGTKFGGSDAAKERYLSHLKSRQFEKAHKRGQQKMEYSKASKESKGFIRRAHDRKRRGLERDRFSVSRSRRDQELKDLEYNAVRNSLMRGEFAEEKTKVSQRFDDPNSMERKRAEFYGKNYERRLNEQKKEALKEVDQKREYFKDSLRDKVVGPTKAHHDALDNAGKRKLERDLRRAHREIVTGYRRDLKDGKMGKLNKENVNDGLVSTRLKNPLKIGDKEYKDLSLFEVNAMLHAVRGTEGPGSNHAIENLNKYREEMELHAQDGKASKDVVDEKAAADRALEDKAREVQEKGQEDAARALEEYRSKMDALNEQLRDMVTKEREAVEDGEIAQKALQDEARALNDQMARAREEAMSAIDNMPAGSMSAEDTAALKASIDKFDQASVAYSADCEEVAKQEVIVKNLEVDFGQSFADALAVGDISDLGVKGGDPSIGGGGDTSAPIDAASLTSAQMSAAQHKFNIKSNKNKMAHLEYQKGSLEHQLNHAQKEGDSKTVNDLQSQINSIDSEMSGLKRENAMETSRMEEALSAVTNLERGGN